MIMFKYVISVFSVSLAFAIYTARHKLLIDLSPSALAFDDGDKRLLIIANYSMHS